MLVYLQVVEWSLVVSGGGESTTREVHVVGGAQDEYSRPTRHKITCTLDTAKLVPNVNLHI